MEPIAPPFDTQARERIEQVATALMDLCGRLETRIAELEQRQTDVEDALMALGQGMPRG